MIRGPRVLATLGPLSDEIMVYPTRSSLLARDEDAHKYAFAFAVPCGIDGLKFICRESFRPRQVPTSTTPWAPGSRRWTPIVYFDDVLVPWGTGLHVRRPAQVQQHVQRHRGKYVHTGHQVVTKNVAKCEFVTGIASLMVKTLGKRARSPRCRDSWANWSRNLEITKALLTQSEVNASIDEWGRHASRPRTPECRAQPLHQDVPQDG